MGRKHIPVGRESDAENGPVHVVRPGIDILDKEVREVALELADGDPRRIEVLSHQEAIVRAPSVST